MPQAKRCEWAKRIFTHHFRSVATRVGIAWDPDSDAEIERAVDEIFAEAVMMAKREVFDHLRCERELLIAKIKNTPRMKLTVGPEPIGD